MINWIRRWVGFLLCRWFKHHTDVLYAVGHNMGKECRYCKRTGTMTPADVMEMRRFLRGEDEVAVEPTPK